MNEIETGSYEHRFGGIGRLYGEEDWQRIRGARALIIGLGGVGTWAAEALTRTGVGNMTLMDWDDICYSNTNRQIHAMDGNQGQSKVDVLAQRIALINPECQVEAKREFFGRDNSEEILSQPWDIILDCIDSIDEKCLLLAMAKRKKLNVVTCGGAGGRHHSEMIRVADLSKTVQDPLLALTRKKLRQDHGFRRDSKKNFGIPCVYSPEVQKYPQADGCVSTTKTSSANMRLDCRDGFGTATYITGVYGMMMAGVAINKMLSIPFKKR